MIRKIDLPRPPPRNLRGADTPRADRPGARVRRAHAHRVRFPPDAHGLKTAAVMCLLFGAGCQLLAA